MSVKFYGNYISQPCRSVLWVLKSKGVDFDMETMNFGSEMFKSPEFTGMNPNGLVPVLKDGDFSMFEGLAILQYLAEKFQWTDLYPEDIQKRAKVQQYMHWHHTGARKMTLEVVRPLLMKSAGAATEEHLKMLEKKDETITKYVELMEKFLVKPYIAETEEPTIADYAAYCEFDQLEALKLFDFSKYPAFSAWLERMKTLPMHDEVGADMRNFFGGSK